MRRFDEKRVSEISISLLLVLPPKTMHICVPDLQLKHNFWFLSLCVDLEQV